MVKTYDRDLGDVLKLQTQIATAVADALKVTLLADTATKIELGGTRNPAAFDAYLRATKAEDTGGAENYLSATAAYTEAIQLDPNYALAFAGRSFVQSLYAGQNARVRWFASTLTRRLPMRTGDRPRAEPGRRPLALGFYLANGALDFKQALDEFGRARKLAHGDARIS